MFGICLLNKPMETIQFSDKEEKKLFAIVRESIFAALGKKNPPQFTITEDNLLLKRGVFITLSNQGKLRGCIGNFNPAYPLWDMVARMGVAAATQDYRFALNPITETEMEDIDIKILPYSVYFAFICL